MSKRNSYDSARKSRKINNFLKTVATVLVCITILGVAGAFVSGGLDIENPFKKDVNEKNLIKVDDYEISSGNTGKGIEIDVKEDGAIKVKGEATSSGTLTVATFLLEPGTYTFSGVNDPNRDQFGLVADFSNGQTPVYAGINPCTFTLTSAAEVTVSLFWGKDYKVSFANRMIYPTLVSGNTAGDFYS